MMVNCGVEAVAYYGTRPLCKEHADLQDKDRLIFIKKTETKSSWSIWGKAVVDKRHTNRSSPDERQPVPNRV